MGAKNQEDIINVNENNGFAGAFLLCWRDMNGEGNNALETLALRIIAKMGIQSDKSQEN